MGAAASGKTTLRHALLGRGLPPERVVSLDDLRRGMRDADVVAGRSAKEPQGYTLRALRLAAAHQAELLARGEGYLLDATSLRRRDRVEHVRAAHAAGLPAVAVLLEQPPLVTLCARNAQRHADEVVPDDVLARQWHRHGLLDPALLREELFDVVVTGGAVVRAGGAAAAPGGGPPHRAAEGRTSARR